MGIAKETSSTLKDKTLVELLELQKTLAKLVETASQDPHPGIRAKIDNLNKQIEEAKIKMKGKK